jgi:hypothetical protein
VPRRKQSLGKERVVAAPDSRFESTVGSPHAEGVGQVQRRVGGRDGPARLAARLPKCAFWAAFFSIRRFRVPNRREGK